MNFLKEDIKQFQEAGEAVEAIFGLTPTFKYRTAALGSQERAHLFPRLLYPTEDLGRETGNRYMFPDKVQQYLTEDSERE